MRIVVLMIAATALFPASLVAQTYPERPIRLIVPFPPGGGTDIAARTVGQKLTERWGQQVIVDNRGGANGNIAVELAARASPNGYTLLIGSTGPIAINPSLYAKLPVAPLRDLAAVAMVAPTYYVLVAHPSLPVNAVRDIAQLARTSKPSFASAGVGSPGHLAAEMLKMMAGIDILHVPYKGTGPAVADLLGGQVNMMFSDMIAVIPLVSSGKLKSIAIASAKRNPRMPAVPTVAESGVAGYEALGWSLLFAPSGTPTSIIDRLNAEVRNILALADVRERLAIDDREFGTESPSQVSAFVSAETAKWAKVIKASGARAD